jgi:thiamine-phosphate pyrophosphorylase
MTTFLSDALRGGIDVVQLREKLLPPTSQLNLAKEMASICHEYDVPFIVNDSPELALDAGADGVHVGQDDASVERCRTLLGPDALVGLSTHAQEEFRRALLEGATYFSAGPIVQTPTKPGREATGVDYPLWCQSESTKPVFVTGGVNESNIALLVAKGLEHFVVVRALSEASDIFVAAKRLRNALDEALNDAGRANQAT